MPVLTFCSKRCRDILVLIAPGLEVCHPFSSGHLILSPLELASKGPIHEDMVGANLETLASPRRVGILMS